MVKWWATVELKHHCLCTRKRRNQVLWGQRSGQDGGKMIQPPQLINFFFYPRNTELQCVKTWMQSVFLEQQVTRTLFFQNWHEALLQHLGALYQSYCFQGPHTLCLDRAKEDTEIWTVLCTLNHCMQIVTLQIIMLYWLICTGRRKAAVSLWAMSLSSSSFETMSQQNVQYISLSYVSCYMLQQLVSVTFKDLKRVCKWYA